ncbi:hypothetical protein LTR37_020600 [Vermiconidia calcicola]|uniref:Uncharacterized protein n=1 Tax=Vermiconidia calcicola TaxID=1690605 RepID=A0ACC3MAS9_9PEZI|nr:hypothetical protein LTR37_020600 [Vermiconidia calcicola]
MLYTYEECLLVDSKVESTGQQTSNGITKAEQTQSALAIESTRAQDMTAVASKRRRGGMCGAHEDEEAAKSPALANDLLGEAHDEGRIAGFESL